MASAFFKTCYKRYFFIFFDQVKLGGLSFTTGWLLEYLFSGHLYKEKPSKSKIRPV